ncbi:phage tail protein [Lentibacillus sp. Marseille-P4043]|uniref:phage tail protein n=1 Tax=Lentibacillus sp. Marseille-P4043 TaxID=2040293 RepID=UPI000D0B68D2|nr:phage tail protein [Lentibacillus sp. Marseille-P4043]
MIGFFGDIIFETSDKRIVTFTGFQRDAGSRWSKHDVIGAKPSSEFIGPDLDTISFSVNLNGFNGVKPRIEMDRWLRKERAGEVAPLVIGDSYLGVDKWRISSVSQMWGVVLNRGEVLSGKVDIELEEYIERIGSR